jgi:hypothetical protein
MKGINIKDIKALRKPECPYPEIAKLPETLKQPPFIPA